MTLGSNSFNSFSFSINNFRTFSSTKSKLSQKSTFFPLYTYTP